MKFYHQKHDRHIDMPKIIKLTMYWNLKMQEIFELLVNLEQIIYKCYILAVLRMVQSLKIDAN